MRLDLVDALQDAADNIAGAALVRDLRQPPVGELGEVYDNNFVQNS